MIETAEAEADKLEFLLIEMQTANSQARIRFYLDRYLKEVEAIENRDALEPRR